MLDTDQGYGPQPRNVATICRLTFMCSQVDIHPDATSCPLIADVVRAEIG